jgi:two-component system nitrogen regulation response regulator GlnG/two-component system response regulator HydG
VSLTETIDDARLPWDQAGRVQAPQTSLVVLWSLEEPDRIGESAVVQGERILGRGEAQADDPAPRLRFGRARPGGHTPGPALGGARLSRVQLQLSPRAEGRLLVRSLGRCRLLVNGRETEEAEVGDGDVIHLRNALMLLVVRRKPLARSRAWPAGLDFPFGAADKFGIVGESLAAWTLRDALAVAAGSGLHVLLRGESGAGKELAARALHALSPRGQRPLIARSAATFTETLIDAELFGNTKNFPNVGTPERAGLVGDADGSSLFLDEIGELPPPMQAHLLRFLDRGGEYHRLGESRPRRADVRFIAATNRPIEALKHDFAARLMARVEIPGLGDRPEDVPLIARTLLTGLAERSPEIAARFFERRHGRLAEPRLEPELVELLVRHHYTLHVRELERLLWTSLSSSIGEFVAVTPPLLEALQVSAPPAERPASSAGAPLPDRTAVESALAAAGGRVALAARALGLSSRYVLYRLMRQYGLEGGEEVSAPA